MARALADVLGALEHLAQRREPRGALLVVLARAAHLFGESLVAGDGALVAVDGVAQRAHQAVALARAGC